MGNRSDDFNRADTTNAIGNPSDGGAAWSQTSGTWGISTNRGYESGGGGQRVCVLEASSAVVDVQVTMAVKGSDAGIVWRLADDSNYMLGTFEAVAGNMKMFKKVAGSFTQLGSSATGLTLANNDVVKGSVTSGNAHTLYLNGVAKVGPQTDAAGSANTKHGIRANGDTAARFDDFSITDNGGGGGGARRFNSSLNGLGASGPFFHDRLAA